jgi:hypothetical protein
LIIGRGVGVDLGTRPGDPDAMTPRCVDEELRRRTTFGFGELGGLERESGRERLGQHDEAGATSNCTGDDRSEAFEICLWIVPHDVVLDCGDAQHGHRIAPPSAGCAKAATSCSTAASMTSSRLQHANRTR